MSETKDLNEAKNVHEKALRPSARKPLSSSRTVESDRIREIPEKKDPQDLSQQNEDDVLETVTTPEDEALEKEHGAQEKSARTVARKPLSSQRTVESGVVRQNISHGRSKSVVVETRKTRRFAQPGEAERPAVSRPMATTPAVVIPLVAKTPGTTPPRTGPESQRSGGAAVSRNLSTQEQDARVRALTAAKLREVSERDERDSRARAVEEDARRKAEEAVALAALTALAPPPEPAQDPSPPIVAAAPAARAAAKAPTLTPLAKVPSTKADVAKSASQPLSTPPPVAHVAAPATDTRPLSSRGPNPRRDDPTRNDKRPDPRPDARPDTRPPSGRADPTLRTPAYNTATMPRAAGRPMRIEIPVARKPKLEPTPTPPPVVAEPLVVTPQRAPRAPVLKVLEPEEEESRGNKLARNKAGPKTPTKPTTDDRRERIKLTINNAFDQQQRERSLASLKRKREREKLKAMGISQTREKIVREVIIPEAITIQELANRMTERAVDVIKFLMKQDALHKITDVIDADTAELIAQEFGHIPKRVSEADVESGFIREKDSGETLDARAPVVTIMGHVDHGKTSLLDAIRQTNVVAGEAGGITQHIGAYQVVTPSGSKVTFIDTPGHAAFTAMRARGAKVTDIVVLVVAADDGVMPQTVEAINHAKAANVPIIVAINKIDKPQADPSRVRTELLQHEIVVESLSGETLEVPVSALKRTNLDKLLETIHLQAEVLDLKANPNRSAEGFVIEAKLERGRGPVGTALVQRGTLKVGDIVVAGSAWGRVRALIDDQGHNVASAGPSVPVEVLGFDVAPEAGDQFAVVENDSRAREITDYRIRKRRETLGTAGTARTLEQMMQQIKEVGKKEFTLLIKGDVQGSVEAIAGALKKLNTDEVEARIVHSGVGGITESDVALANASGAVAIGFNVRANVQAKAAADQQGIEVRYYNIIYDLVDDVKAAMSGLLAPTIREVFLGNAQILEVFNITKAGKVAGCRVSDGKVERGAKVRLIRDNVVIHEGTLAILKRFKDDVKEVPAGQECGMSFANYQDIRVGDTIECFQVETIKRTL